MKALLTVLMCVWLTGCSTENEFVKHKELDLVVDKIIAYFDAQNRALHGIRIVFAKQQEFNDGILNILEQQRKEIEVLKLTCHK